MSSYMLHPTAIGRVADAITLAENGGERNLTVLCNLSVQTARDLAVANAEAVGFKHFVTFDDAATSVGSLDFSAYQAECASEVGAFLGQMRAFTDGEGLESLSGCRDARQHFREVRIVLQTFAYQSCDAPDWEDNPIHLRIASTIEWAEVCVDLMEDAVERAVARGKS